jgi:hypothetical protein
MCNCIPFAKIVNRNFNINSNFELDYYVVLCFVMNILDILCGCLLSCDSGKVIPTYVGIYIDTIIAFSKSFQVTSEVQHM